MFNGRFSADSRDSNRPGATVQTTADKVRSRLVAAIDQACLNVGSRGHLSSKDGKVERPLRPRHRPINIGQPGRVSSTTRRARCERMYPTIGQTFLSRHFGLEAISGFHTAEAAYRRVPVVAEYCCYSTLRQHLRNLPQLRVPQVGLRSLATSPQRSRSRATARCSTLVAPGLRTATTPTDMHLDGLASRPASNTYSSAAASSRSGCG